jgi:hypothetical protein
MPNALAVGGATFKPSLDIAGLRDNSARLPAMTALVTLL